MSSTTFSKSHSTTTKLQSTPIFLPPISMFTRLPVSPPTQPLEITSPITSSSPTLDHGTIWHLWNQGNNDKYETSLSPPSHSPSSPVMKEGMSSAQVLAEKRRRNAGASARFRERRKLRERDLQEKCQLLDRRVLALETALKQLDPHHSLLLDKPVRDDDHSSSPPPPPPPQSTLNDRVSQLEQLMMLLRQEKILDTHKLQSLEKENQTLKTKIQNNHHQQEQDDRSIALSSKPHHWNKKRKHSA
ncbi:uncharacterized protein BX664DRAFT_332446 [Halteromyces radiatus]|uniref:uncharacterized protein n=1 Tax=Halteromyces radiatus TaxID=101107 RepID=UPI00221E9D2F|nr:uncharacterized protein BX664DRAFT_332446 [Halteromyces radiatus]KAI8089217.1 hypothetical protein BX664DRAFT_332446 [Halteromyces radiatus]